MISKKYLQKAKQIRMGEKVEAEHIGNKKSREGLKKNLNKIHGKINSKQEKSAAKKAEVGISKDHLRELPDYYTRLKKMEKKKK